jgi:RecA/RadA recombinase
MSVKIVGTHSKPHRIITGLYTLDRAMLNKDGDIGIVIGTGYEIFGLNHVGKSTFTYSLASIIGRTLEGDIALADFEGFDDKFLVQVAETCGFDRSIHVISEQDDEGQLDKLIDMLSKKACVGILDSIGAISPIGEAEGDIGEANMGRRGFLLAQFARKGLKLFRFDKDKTILMINHWYPRLGSRGYDTPGGEVKKYIATVRIKLSRKETFPDGSYALLGEVIKNRWGYQNRQFNAFMLAGFGLHAGMTALWDCVMLKLVKRSKVGLLLDGTNLGKLGIYAKYAKLGTANFDIFYKLLGEYHGSDEADDPESDGDGSQPDPISEESTVLEN